MKPSIYMNLIMTINSVTTPVGQLMTLKITVSQVESVTTSKGRLL